MKHRHQIMSPQDVVILLKIIALDNDNWQQQALADSLGISQSEVSKSIVRSKYARLIDPTGKKVYRLALLDFITTGLAYVFPQWPGSLVKGIPTSHSAPPLNKLIVSNDHYVWPSAKGTVRGSAIQPLIHSIAIATENDNVLYELLALVDAIRVGRAREKEIARKELEKRFFPEVITDKN